MVLTCLQLKMTSKTQVSLGWLEGVATFLAGSACLGAITLFAQVTTLEAQQVHTASAVSKLDAQLEKIREEQTEIHDSVIRIEYLLSK